MKSNFTLMKYQFVFQFQSSARSAKKIYDFFGLISRSLGFLFFYKIGKPKA